MKNIIYYNEKYHFNKYYRACIKPNRPPCIIITLYLSSYIFKWKPY